MRMAYTTPAIKQTMPASVSNGGQAWRNRKVYANPARISNTMSGPTNTVGSRWLASFQHSAPSQEQNTPMISISGINTSGRGPNGKANAGSLNANWPQTAR